MKKSQIKFGETFAVIIIVYLVLVVGVSWFNNSNNKELRELYEEDQIQKSFEKFHYVNTLDIIRVSRGGNVEEELDYNSLIVFASFNNYTLNPENTNSIFANQLGTAKIEIEIYEYDPLKDIDVEPFNNLVLINNNERIVGENYLLLYNNTPENYQNSYIFKNLVSVRDQVAKKTYIGVMTVENYQVQ
jgi:hypothetical protein